MSDCGTSCFSWVATRRSRPRTITRTRRARRRRAGEPRRSERETPRRSMERLRRRRRRGMARGAAQPNRSHALAICRLPPTRSRFRRLGHPRRRLPDRLGRRRRPRATGRSRTCSTCRRRPRRRAPSRPRSPSTTQADRCLPQSGRLTRRPTKSNLLPSPTTGRLPQSCPVPGSTSRPFPRQRRSSRRQRGRRPRTLTSTAASAPRATRVSAG